MQCKDGMAMVMAPADVGDIRTAAKRTPVEMSGVLYAGCAGRLGRGASRRNERVLNAPVDFSLV